MRLLTISTKVLDIKVLLEYMLLLPSDRLHGFTNYTAVFVTRVKPSLAPFCSDFVLSSPFIPCIQPTIFPRRSLGSQYTYREPTWRIRKNAHRAEWKTLLLSMHLDEQRRELNGWGASFHERTWTSWNRRRRDFRGKLPFQRSTAKLYVICWEIRILFMQIILSTRHAIRCGSSLKNRLKLCAELDPEIIGALVKLCKSRYFEFVFRASVRQLVLQIFNDVNCNISKRGVRLTGSFRFPRFK